MKPTLYILTLYSLLLIFSQCNKEKTPEFGRTMNDSIVIHLKNTTVEKSLDSTDFLLFIGNQKIQDVYDLASWKNNDASQDSVLNTQIQNYFWEQDTLSPMRIHEELDSLGVAFTKIDDLKVFTEDSLATDSTGTMLFDIYFFDKDKNYINRKPKAVKYILKKEDGLRNQFSFYLYELSENDTKPAGDTQ